MRLVVQIPCFNEEGTLPETLAAIPREVAGFDEVRILVVDDGSSDRTREVARAHGADLIVGFPTNRGLAQAFMLGIRTALELNADVIVNTDADNQYCAADLPRITEPILRGEADLVVGVRPIHEMTHFSASKRLLQVLGSAVVRFVSGTRVADAPSGFRAFSRATAARLNVFSTYTYTLETLIQAGQKGLHVAAVPVRVNPPRRPSRLIRSTFSYVIRSVTTIFRIFLLYRPVPVLATIAACLAISGVALGVRFLVFFAAGEGGGHVQSLILSAVLVLMGFQTAVLALIADLLAVNRRVIEELQERSRSAALSSYRDLQAERPTDGSRSASVE